MTPNLPIAVIAANALFANSNDAKEFWNNIINKRDLVTDIPSTHWLIEDYFDPENKAMDKTYCKRGSFLNYQDFDFLEFGVPPAIAPATDSAQLLSLLVAKKVLHEATQGRYSEMDLSRVSVILGSCPLQSLTNAIARLQHPVWEKALREYGLPEKDVENISRNISEHYIPWQENTFPGLLSNVVAGRIANRFNLGGTNCITDAACAGSLAALSMAVNELQLKKADLVITGGVDALNDIFMYMCFSKTQALSFSGDCRPFSDRADGTILGEGIAMFALKRLADAEAQGDSIYAVIKGIGTSSDGRSKSIYAPVPAGQSKALHRAYDAAGYAPETVGLVEGHGTGTKAGDKAEFDALKNVFSKSKSQQCALGSVKSQIGHTKAAAGAAGMFKAVMALHHKILPPTIKVDQPNPGFNIEHSPFYLNTETRPWIKNKKHPRRAGVSSFGFGGSNFHVTLEEYTGKNQKPPRFRLFPTELIIISEKDVSSLLNKCRKILEQDRELSAIAHQTQHELDKKACVRLAIVAEDKAQFRKKLQHALSLAGDESLMLEQGIYYGNNLDPGKIAFLTPDPGNAYLNMTAALTMAFPICMQVWENSDLHELVFPHPVFSEQERLAQEQRLCSEKSILNVVSKLYSDLLAGLNIQPDFKSKPDQIDKLYQKGVRTFIEAGPHNTLTKQLRKRFSDVTAIHLDRQGVHGVTVLWHALGKLTALGLTPDFSILWNEFEIPAQVPQKASHAIKVNGAHYGKPYPNGTVSPIKPDHEKQSANVYEQFQKNMSKAQDLFSRVMKNMSQLTGK